MILFVRRKWIVWKIKPEELYSRNFYAYCISMFSFISEANTKVFDHAIYAAIERCGVVRFLEFMPQSRESVDFEV